MYSKKYRIEENISWRGVIDKIFYLVDDVGIENYLLNLMSVWERDFLLSLSTYLRNNKSSILSKKQQKIVLKIRAEICSTMEMIDRNDPELQQCPTPRQLPFAKQEIKRCYAAGMFWDMMGVNERRAALSGVHIDN